MAEREEISARDYVYPNGERVQVLRWSGQREFIDFSGTTARVTLPAGAQLIEIAATEDCYLNFGGATVDATGTPGDDASRLFIKGVQQVPVPIDPGTDEPYTHVAAIQSATAGRVQVEKLV